MEVQLPYIVLPLVFKYNKFIMEIKIIKNSIK